MTKKLIIIPVVLLILLVGSCQSLSRSEKNLASRVVGDYYAALAEEDYERAYDMHSAFDKANISRELYLEFRRTEARVKRLESFELSPQVDSFRNYSYLGMTYEKAAGLALTLTEEPGGERLYRQMAALEGNEWLIVSYFQEARLKAKIDDWKKQLEN